MVGIAMAVENRFRALAGLEKLGGLFLHRGGLSSIFPALSVWQAKNWLQVNF
jgi:hypothetical protein